MKKTLGGDRIGSGSKMKVDLHGYERSTHDLGYLWRSTMSAGTLVPFMSEVGLPGDTFDINLDCDIKTHPTIGPLFGSYKVQLDVYECPIRLYQGLLHNNKLGIGMQMSKVKLPQIKLYAYSDDVIPLTDPDNAQINPSCILSYLNIRGVGTVNGTGASGTRTFNAIPFLGYWDIYKNYYANKQEEEGVVIHQPYTNINHNVTVINVQGITGAVGVNPITVSGNITLLITYTGGIGSTPIPWTIIFGTTIGDISLEFAGAFMADSGTVVQYMWKWPLTGTLTLLSWRYAQPFEAPQVPVNLVRFPLTDIDDMRELLLADNSTTTPYYVNDAQKFPYKLLLNAPVAGKTAYNNSQEGLGIKTYQSDLFNNWLSTEWIDGANGISEVTAIDTSGGSFTIDTLNLSRKVYNMLNRILVSGGSYDDWLDVTYDHERYTRCESPIYHGGLSKELVFQEVISNVESPATNGSAPLGTLAGRGVLAKKHKGGRVTIKVSEPSYIIGIVSLTPRIDNSQGNKWDTHLQTMDDLHKPALDEIGFQELITEQMAWFGTYWDGTKWVTQSAGKQPAWINYMTNVNQTRGNFAIKDNEMFMTLNRRYEWAGGAGVIDDLTTYIDPVKYNQIFAETAIDSQNFWTQIAVDITARRKMSAKIMPNL